MTADSDRPVSATSVVTGVTTVELEGAFKTRSATVPPVFVSTVPVTTLLRTQFITSVLNLVFRNNLAEI